MRVEGICRHRVAQDRFVGTFLRQSSHKRFPGAARVAGSVNPQPAIACAAKLVRLDGNDIHAVGVFGMHNHREPKIRRHSIGDIDPAFGAVIRAVKSPMILQEQTFGTGGMDRDLVHALPELGILFG